MKFLTTPSTPSICHTFRMHWVAGVDSCRGGWFVVLRNTTSAEVRCREVAAFEAVLALDEAPVVIAIDMIIGLPEEAMPGGRACDRQARALLGGPRASSVFSPPVRRALAASTYEAALALNRASSDAQIGLSKMAFNLFPKVREVDQAMTPERQERVYEVHPELSFYAMDGDTALVPSKHTAKGRARRRALLEAAGFEAVQATVEQHRSVRVRPDDVLDAHAACWSARRIQSGVAVCIPQVPPRDARGLRMEIWR